MFNCNILTKFNTKVGAIVNATYVALCYAVDNNYISNKINYV